MRIGHGYDAHRFCRDKQMVLGATAIDCEFGFLAHSDGDVLLHAVIDALFGAAGMPDIGAHFPDTDEAYKNADSRRLLRECADMVRAAGFAIEYIDVTVIAQMPKLSPYIDAMRKNTAKAAGIDPARLNIKATTEEKMGFTGRLEGVRVHAVCLLSEE